MSKNKLSTEERIKAVESYIQGIMGLSEVLRTYAIPKPTFPFSEGGSPDAQ